MNLLYLVVTQVILLNSICLLLPLQILKHIQFKLLYHNFIQTIYSLKYLLTTLLISMGIHSRMLPFWLQWHLL